MNATVRSILDKMVENSRCTVTIDQYQVNEDAKAARVRMRVVANADATKADIVEAINGKFGGALRAVPSSFVLCSDSTERSNGIVAYADGYVVPNIEVIEVSSDKAGTFKELACNMFMDEADCIWTQAGNFLYKKSGVESSDNFNELLSVCAAEGAPVTRMKRTAPFTALAAAGGQFVTFLAKGEMCAGFVVATDPATKQLMVLAANETEPELIPSFSVASVQHLTDDVKYPTEVEMSGVVDINALIAYYKRVYQYNPAYFAQLESRIRSHAFI
jgi:hypothetical protein